MNHKYLDTLWFQAQHEAIEAGEPFTRYRFANLVYEQTFKDANYAASRTVTDAAVALEREACAQVCESMYGKLGVGNTSLVLGSLACAAAIRARGNSENL